MFKDVGIMKQTMHSKPVDNQVPNCKVKYVSSNM